MRQVAGLIRSGKVRAWGIVNWPPTRSPRWQDRGRAGGANPSAAQLAYSVAMRSPVEDEEMVAALEACGAPVVASYAMLGGVLTGKYLDADEAALGRPARRSAPSRRPGCGSGAPRAGRPAGTHAAALAISFPLLNPNVASVLFGATSPEQIAANVAALRLLEGLDEAPGLSSVVSAQPPELTLERALGALYGLAIGDALGMPTQELSRPRRGGSWAGAGFRTGPPENPIWRGLPAGSVTDDSLQSLLIAGCWSRAGPDRTAAAGQRAARLGKEDGGRRKTELLGPSTKAALAAVAAGADPATTGGGGLTNGAAMRIARSASRCRLSRSIAWSGGGGRRQGGPRHRRRDSGAAAVAMASPAALPASASKRRSDRPSSRGSGGDPWPGIH